MFIWWERYNAEENHPPSKLHCSKGRYRKPNLLKSGIHTLLSLFAQQGNQSTNECSNTPLRATTKGREAFPPPQYSWPKGGNFGAATPSQLNCTKYGLPLVVSVPTIAAPFGAVIFKFNAIAPCPLTARIRIGT